MNYNIGMKTSPLFSSFFSQKAVFFFLMGLFGVLFLLPKYSFADTIHSTEQGGSWTQTTTWVEGVLPTENDDVEINGYVYLPYLSEQHIHNLTITQNGTLSTRYSDHAGKIYTYNVYNEGTIKWLNVYVSENIENNGTLYSATLHLSGDTINNGTFIRCCYGELSSIIFYGTNTKTIQGLENQDVTITLMDDLYVNSESLILPNLHTRDHIFHGNLYLHGNNNTPYYFNGALNFIIDGNLHFSGGFNSHTQHIQANTITLEHDTHVNLGSDNNHIYGITLLGMNSRIGATRYGEKIHFHDKIFAQENASIATSSGVFFYDDVDFYGTLDFGHKTVFIANDIPNKDHYFFEYILNGYQGNTDGEGNNYGWRISRVQDQDGNYIELKDILLDRTQSFQWRTKTNEDGWSEWHTFNKPLYLEENTHFFETEVNDVTENEEQTITITAEDNDYTGDISLSVDEGNVSPSTVHMENGTITTNVSFDTPQENTKLYVQSQNYNTLSGESNSFTVNHQIQYTFFTVPVIDNGEVEREMLVTLNASEQDYEGDVNITYHSIDGEGNDITETLDNAHFSQENPTTQFSFTPQETTQNAYFSFQDTNKDYLLGTSNHFYVIPKPHHHGGSIIGRKKLSQIFGNTFLDQGETEETQNEQDEEPNNEEVNNDTNETEESNTDPVIPDEIRDPEYLLENTCLDIHSIYPSLSKSRRTLLKSIPREKHNVKNLQQKLKDLHFLNGYVDGDFGIQTKQALQDFQEQNGLYTDGIFGNQSSHFIDTHCNHLDEKITEEHSEENEQNQNDETNNEQEEQAPPAENNFWFNNIKDWFEDSWNNIMNALGFGEEDKEEVFDQVISFTETQEQEEDEKIKIITFTSDRFIGKKLLFEESFLPSIQKLEQFARDSHVKIFITQSLRNPSDTLTNTVVTPSKKSNHYVGHAIDMNIKLDSGEFCNGSCMERGDYEEVNNFLNLIRGDETLRWGGDFSDVDPVHSDDGLNIRKPQEWLRIFTKISYNKLYD